MKVDIFCLGSSAFDRSEFERAAFVRIHGLDPEARIRVKSPEDTILRKLDWYRSGGGVSERQWSDVVGCLSAQEGSLDRAYLDRWAGELGLRELLRRALDASSGA